MTVRILGAAVGAALWLSSCPAQAAGAPDPGPMGWPWALPFIGMLLSIATGPVLFADIWHRHYGKIAAGWAALTVVPLALVYGVPVALAAVVHAMLGDYLSFIALLFALYTVAGGILIVSSLRGNPLLNVAVLAFGTLVSSIAGTTGAAMILVRPLLRANAPRARSAHVVIFFIMIVCNVGGALSPIGNPPLFGGFLHGVDFFWPVQNMWLQTSIVAVLLLAAFFAIDSWFYRHDPPAPASPSAPIAVHGAINLVFIVLIIASVLLTAAWKPGVSFDVYGTRLELENLACDLSLFVVAALSLWATPDEHRQANDFAWEPMREVAKLFAGIFVAIIPVLSMLAAGRSGAFAWLFRLVDQPGGVPDEAAYFWTTGLLSAFLDNLPTYLMFFEIAGGNAQELMGPLAGTLVSISIGAVYMGALTYIGNAPNFMVYAIALEHGIRMPSFFGYLLWAAIVLIPILLLLTLLPIHPLLPVMHH
jgi:Na+/H+ antiporter NhaD/arsenite permease-like protein